ncbi:hypothetical protein WKW79_27840 [Variovorax robiniae]|uniref:Uncharacterized protein n=1 Tax=Variovorax robiniae TaxID=1836199 RepID=A0ABU8XFU4_9BURK
MNARKYTGLSNASLHDDGLTFNITLETEDGAVPLEVPVAEISKLTHMLAKVSIASGEIRALPRHFAGDGTLTLRPVDASAMAVMKGEPGRAMVLLLVGATTMAYSLDARQVLAFSEELQAVAGQLGPDG